MTHSVVLVLVIALGMVSVALAQVNCITNPQDHSCHDYHYPNAKSTVGELCGMMSNMPVCSIEDICKVPSLNSSRPECTYFSLMADGCTDMAMGVKGCSDWQSMCYPTAGKSMVAECNTVNLTAVIPSYQDTKLFVTRLCALTPQPDIYQCHKCADGEPCNYLDVYSELCKLMGNAGECEEWRAMCAVVGPWNWPICNAPPAPAVDCINHNSDPVCKNYIYPNPAGVVKTMCDMMGTMPTCSVNSNVCSQSSFSSSEYCAPFSLMADVCTDMVMGVQGCMDYRKMCSNTSVIQQCQTPSLKNILPTYNQAKGYVTGICAEMSMEGCDKCASGSCDFLSVYSQLCMAMPEMKQCSAWKTLCTVTPQWPYCPSSNGDNPHQGPMMRMYFHTGLMDYVLFQGWVPRTKTQYAFTWIAVFVAGILLEALKFLRARIEKRWAGTRLLSLQNDFDVAGSGAAPSAWSLPVDLPRAALQTLELAWGYLLMLVAMTFNVGLFFAVLAGCFVGTLVFGRFLTVLPRPRGGAASCH